MAGVDAARAACGHRRASLGPACLDTAPDATAPQPAAGATIEASVGGLASDGVRTLSPSERAGQARCRDRRALAGARRGPGVQSNSRESGQRFRAWNCDKMQT